MEKVYAFKEEDLKKAKDFFKLKNKIVMLHLLTIGTNIALRVSDLRILKFEDITKFQDKLIIDVVEQKTKKRRRIIFNNTCKKSLDELKRYYKKLGYDSSKGYLFKSSNRENIKNLVDTPITKSGINKNLKMMEDYLNFDYPIGSHSLRKTWGMRAYEKYKKIGIVSMALGHSSEKVTMRYLGIEEEDILGIFEDLEI